MGIYECGMMRIPEDRVIMKLFLRNKLFSNTNRIVGGGLLFLYCFISINHWRGRLVGGYRLSSPFIASVYRFSSSNFVLGKTCTPVDKETIKIDVILASNPILQLTKRNAAPTNKLLRFTSKFGSLK